MERHCYYLPARFVCQMDDVDLSICKLLFNNSRCPEREVADKLGLSVSAVHRRINQLVEERVIREFSANISGRYLKAIGAQVDGVCDCKSIEDSLDELKKSDSITGVLVSAANLTSLVLLLRDISYLGPTVEHIRATLQMQQPKVTISTAVYLGDEPFDRAYTGSGELSKIDYRIVNSLHHNSRKQIVDIAEETGLTPKTIRNHLEQMEKDGSIEYALRWNPAYSAGASFIFRADLKPGTDKNKFISTLNKRFGARIILTFIHSNILDYVCGYGWAPTIAKQTDMIDELKEEDVVVNVTSSIVQKEWSFESWRDKVLIDGAKSKA